MKHKEHIQGTVFLVIALLSHGLYGVFSRVIGVGFGQVFQVVARSTILLIFFSCAAKAQNSWKKIAPKDYKWFLLMILPGLVALISMFTAFNHLALGTVLFTYYAVSTLASYMLGFWMFQEKLNKIKLMSLLLSFLGLYIIFYNSMKPGALIYLGLACLAGGGAAAWNTFSKKISSTYSITQLLIVDSLLLVVCGLSLSLILHEPVSLPRFTLPWLGIMGYALAAIGSSIFTIKGFRYLQAQTGSLILLLEPVFGAGIGWLLYQEHVGFSFCVGALFILIGAALPNLKLTKK